MRVHFDIYIKKGRKKVQKTTSENKYGQTEGVE